MIELARRYGRPGEGGKLGKYRVPAIIFAEDLGLVAATEAGLRRLIGLHERREPALT